MNQNYTLRGRAITMLQIAGLLLMSGSVFAQHTYYISKSLGNDSNTSTQAQSKSTPWQHLPGMNGCTTGCATPGGWGCSCEGPGGGYSPVAGDQFILYGGDTWTNSDLGIEWDGSGSSGSPIYIGVDETWYSGASWTRPIWTCGGSACAGTGNQANMITIYGNYITLDNIEMTGYSFVNDGKIVQVYSSNVTVEHVYAHGWNHTGETNDNGIVFTASTCCGGGTNDNFLYDIADGSDTTGDAAICFGSQITIIAYSYCADATNGAEGSQNQVHDTWIGPINLCFTDAGCHQNAIQQSGPTSGSNTFFYNNVITQMASGGVTKLWLGQATGGVQQTAYAFNNVLFNNVAGNDVNNCQEGTSCGTYYYFNNTFECGNSNGVDACQSGSAGATQTAVWINNHCIATACVNVTNPTYSYTETTDLIQSVSTAASLGYTYSSTYAFQPTSASGGTVGQGTNLQSLCTTINAIDSTAGAACARSTGYACSYNTSNHTLNCPNDAELTRPTSGAWNIGAYQFPIGCTITPTSLGPYTTGQAVSQQFTASGCSSSSFTISSGSLSGSGLTLSSGGLLSGTAQAGSFSFTIAYGTATDPISLTVNAAGCTITPTSLGPYTTGQAVSQQFTASGCSSSSFTISSGSLSGSGLTLGSGGLLSGTAQAGSFSFTIAYGTATDPISLTVNAAGCTITPTSLGPYTTGQAVSQQFTASGCSSSSFTISSGSLSGSGLALGSGGLLSGTAQAGSFSFTIAYGTATDPISLTVNASSTPITLHTTFCGVAGSWPGTCTLSAPTTAGSRLVVVYSSYNSAGSTPVINSITDGGDTFSPLPGARSTNTNNASSWNDVWSANNVAAGVTTLTITPSTTQTGDVFVWELQNAGYVVACGSASSQPAANPAVGQSMTVPANLILLAHLHPAPGGNPTAVSSPYTSDGLPDGMAYAEYTASTSGFYPPQWTQAATTFATATCAFSAVPGTFPPSTLSAISQ